MRWLDGITDEMHQTKKGEQCYFGMKMHAGVDAKSGLIHSTVYTPANAPDVKQVGELLHGQEKEVWGDAGYRGAYKYAGSAGKHIRWSIAMRPSDRRALDKKKETNRLLVKIERVNAGIRAKVEHVFHVIKNIFGYDKARYRGIYKNASRLTELATMHNLWKASNNSSLDKRRETHPRSASCRWHNLSFHGCSARVHPRFHCSDGR